MEPAQAFPAEPGDARRDRSVAVELARLAGAEIQSTLGKVLAVEYKGARRKPRRLRFAIPVSEVDRKVETLIRARLADSFPGHDILGEESEDRPGRESEFVWAIDPIDGTTNFVNGFPFSPPRSACSTEHEPVAGALWCSTSHALRAGVYHAHTGAPLRFDEERSRMSAIRRCAAGWPASRGDRAQGVPWDVRKTGSAAIECAFVAAGLFRVARSSGRMSGTSRAASLWCARPAARS